MTRLTWLSTLVAALALSLAACAPKYPKCEKDDQCKEHGEVCVRGACVECGRDSDCKAGYVCREAVCTPRPECAADSECGPGLKCRGERCVAECGSAADCGQGMSCKSGRCMAPEACLSDNDCAGGMRCEANRCTEAGPGACALPVIYFGFNEYALTGEAQQTLDNTAVCIKQGKVVGVLTLAGHGDERGTEEYNLHLGERRASAVKRYLSALGVDSSNLRTVSFGEERPADSGHGEAAWARNRRVEVSK